MDENELETVDSANDTETTENKEGAEDIKLDLDNQEEDVEELKKKLATSEAQRDHWKKKATETKPSEKPKKENDTAKQLSTDNLSTLDAMALIKADVSEREDIEKVLKWANLNGQTIGEALKDKVIVDYLNDVKEKRNSAKVAQTGNARITSQPSSEAIIEKARKGELKEEDIDKVVAARMEARLKAKS